MASAATRSTTRHPKYLQEMGGAASVLQRGVDVFLQESREIVRNKIPSVGVRRQESSGVGCGVWSVSGNMGLSRASCSGGWNLRFVSQKIGGEPFKWLRRPADRTLAIHWRRR